MQNRQMGKGAERKTFCALFLWENEKSGQVFCRKKEIGTRDRKSVKEELRTGEMELIVIGYPGMQEAAKLAAESRETLRKTIPGWMLDEVIRTDEKLRECFAELVGDESNAQRTDKEKLLGILFPITDKGIFAALWELGEALCCGIDGQLLEIPMKQSVIEICNAERLSPYEIPSGGSGLFVTGSGRRMEEFFAKKDLPAAVIGRITAGADRVLRMEDQVRYLDAR